MMHLVVFDIADDRLRARVGTACLDAGLVRVQYSAYRGDLSPARRRRLEQRLVRLTAQSEGCDIQIYSLCQQDFAAHVRYTDGVLVNDQPVAPEVVVY